MNFGEIGLPSHWTYVDAVWRPLTPLVRVQRALIGAGTAISDDLIHEAISFRRNQVREFTVGL